MNISSCKFITSLPINSDLMILDKPVFAFVGRSNSGKSSLLNTLSNQIKLAKVGQTPGVTKTANVFLANNKFYLVDLPGYGFAKMSKTERIKLENLIFWFLLNKYNNLRQLYILIDSKIGLTILDQEFIDFVDQQQIPSTLIASKIDKLKPSHITSQLKQISFQHNKNYPLIPFSNIIQKGKNELIESILSLLK